MPFLKLPLEKAYAIGALRTNLDMAHLIAKLERAGLKAEMRDGRLHVACDDESFVFGAWEADGVGRIGWLEMRIITDVGRLSRRMAQAGIRHRFDYSRPRDLETNDVRCVTQYDYRWDRPGLPPHGADVPAVTMFDEQV